jgi:hypothetical protein
MVRDLSGEVDSLSTGQDLHPLFMEPEDLLPPSQDPAIRFYFQFIPQLHTCFLIHYSIASSMPRSLKWTLPFGFTVENVLCVSHLPCACYPAHLILLALVTSIISGEEHK